MKAGMDLSQLKELANAVGPKHWQVWENTHCDPVVVEAGKRGVFSEICKVSTRFDDYGRAALQFIAALDPATVLALIERAESAEKPTT